MLNNKETNPNQKSTRSEFSNDYYNYLYIPLYLVSV